MRMLRPWLTKPCTIALALATLAAPASLSAADAKSAAASKSAPRADSRVRSGWTFGIQYGGGLLDMPDPGLDRKSGSGMRVSGAYYVTPRATLGLEGLTWGAKKSGLKRSLQLMSLTGTYHPGGNSYYLKAGAGVGSVSHDSFDRDSMVVVQEDNGFASTIGAGYDRHLFRSVNLGLEFDYSPVGFGGGGPDNLIVLTAGLAYRW
jgi:hypothetical protein